MEYMVEFDGIKGCTTAYYTVESWSELLDFVAVDLKILGGGHADIFDSEGEFVDDYEL